MVDINHGCFKDVAASDTPQKSGQRGRKKRCNECNSCKNKKKCENPII